VNEAINVARNLSVHIELLEKAVLARDPSLSITVVSWTGRPVIRVELAEATKLAMDDFCNKFLKANPKK
jgi:hypothetical protein